VKFDYQNTKGNQDVTTNKLHANWMDPTRLIHSK